MIRLKLWRLQQGMTQAQAARRVGIGESTLAMLESGRLRPTPGQIDHLRATFGAEVNSIFDPVQERVGGAV
jgi:transcriptional regulator with XRE-family HTH domain